MWLSHDQKQANIIEGKNLVKGLREKGLVKRTKGLVKRREPAIVTAVSTILMK